MEICYTKLGLLRAVDISIKEDKSYVKYLCTYENREKDLPILLYPVDIKQSEDRCLCYYKEYYTGNIVVALDSVEKSFKELDNKLENNNDKKLLNLPSLAVLKSDLKKIDDDFIKSFYLNEQLNKIDSIIEDIDHLVNKTQKNVKCYLTKLERAISFKCLEEAYFDNAIYDLKKGYTYKIKRKVIDKK